MNDTKLNILQFEMYMTVSELTSDADCTEGEEVVTITGNESLDVFDRHRVKISYTAGSNCYKRTEMSDGFGEPAPTLSTISATLPPTTTYYYVEAKTVSTRIENRPILNLELYISEKVLLPWQITLSFCCDGSRFILWVRKDSILRAHCCV